MCHYKLWPTSVSHPFSSFNRSLGLAGGKHHQKITIPIFRLQNLALRLLYLSFFSVTIFSLFFLPVGLILQDFMCHYKLWPTSVSHPFSSFNRSLGLAGGKHHQKITIPIFRLQNLALRLLYLSFFSVTIFSLFFLPVGLILQHVAPF